MFNNLIESTSHAQEFKRRGSFLLFTTATYLVLFAIAGVASIYAYDAHLESQRTELEITFIPIGPPQPEPARSPTRPAPNPETVSPHPMRIDLIDSASNPTNIPEHIGTVASPIPPAPPNAIIGSRNYDPPAPSFAGVPGGTGNTPVVTIPDNPPPPSPPAPSPTPVRVLKISHVLNSYAISLPKPIYPPLAIRTRTQGTVTVRVLIDETGKVISAKAEAGHPFLIPEAQRAAMQARFSPTIVGEQAVKVSGIITYNFVMP